MHALKSLPIRAAARGRTSRLSQTPRARLWRQTGRRGYASTAESAKEAAKDAGSKVKGSELPWIAGAVGVTVFGTWAVLDPSKLGPVFNHALPGDHYHGEGHEEEHEQEEEAQEEEEGGGEEGQESAGSEGDESGDGGDGGESSKGGDDASEKSSEGGDSDDSKSEQSEGQDTPDTSSDEKEPSPSDEKAQVGRNQPGEKGVGVGKLEQAKELPPGPKGERRFLVPDSKGGNMRRVESPKGIVLGRAEGQTEGGSIGDVKDGQKSAVAGQTSSQQKGLSNTDTKHSVDIMADPEKSKKSEGVPETAKIQGTVQPGRKGV